MRRISGSAQRPAVSVLTPTIAGRAPMLEQCELSVKAQTSLRWEHLIGFDHDLDGCAVTMNRIANDAAGEWLLPLADDDLLLPGCLDNLLAASDDADIVYSPPLVNGNEDRWWFFQAPPAIPSCALIRRSLWENIGGYDETLAHEEDRDLWTKAVSAGSRFVRVDEPCWVYRQWRKPDGHPGNKSFAKEAAP